MHDGDTRLGMNEDDTSIMDKYNTSMMQWQLGTTITRIIPKFQFQTLRVLSSVCCIQEQHESTRGLLVLWDVHGRGYEPTFAQIMRTHNRSRGAAAGSHTLPTRKYGCLAVVNVQVRTFNKVELVPVFPLWTHWDDITGEPALQSIWWKAWSVLKLTGSRTPTLD